MESKNTKMADQFVSKRREKAIIIGSTVLVLAALTIAGLYVSNTAQSQDLILQDMTGIEENLTEDSFPVAEEETENAQEVEDVESSTVENPGRTGSTASSSASGNKASGSTQISSTLQTTDELTVEDISEGELLEEGVLAEEMLAETVEEMMYSFTGDGMIWPIMVDYEILIPYSMDKAVYFTTLDQYKYSPAMVLSAEVGTPVFAVSAGKVISRYWDEETGWTYEMDLGGGFTAYYGQLDNLSMIKEEDTYVAAGDLLGYVAEPTKYYSMEGSNLYFAMEKDGTPVYPMDYLGQE
ncbi:MAG: M23 family metallopeptidase [Lachnospiraceae bacterium]|nr:M23 family metallopeptidase [Lachnospiraceae bacterium]